MNAKSNAYMRIARKYSSKQIKTMHDVEIFFTSLDNFFSADEIDSILADLTEEIYDNSHNDEYAEYDSVEYPQDDGGVIKPKEIDSPRYEVNISC